MSNQNVVVDTFNFDNSIAGDFPTSTTRVLLASGQGVLSRLTALGPSKLTIGAAVAGTHAGTETVTAPTLQANAVAGVYSLKCTTAGGAGVGTFSVINPLGVRLADAVHGTAYVDQIGFTIGGGNANAGDTYTVMVTDGTFGTAVSEVAAGNNGGDATLATASTLSTAIVGNYLLTCTAVDGGGVGTFSVTDPAGNALAAATQAVAYSTQISFTIGGDAPRVGDTFIVVVVPAEVSYLVVNQAHVDGSQKMQYVLTDDKVDTTNAVHACVYETGKFNAQAVTFGGTDTWANHVNDKSTIILNPNVTPDMRQSTV